MAKAVEDKVAAMVDFLTDFGRVVSTWSERVTVCHSTWVAANVCLSLVVSCFLSIFTEAALLLWLGRVAQRRQRS